MKPAILFEHVYKKYKLGAGHTSLREFLSKSVSTITGRNKNSIFENEIFWALSDVSFSVPKGSGLGLIGPNGAGKTTTLKILAMVVEQTSGKVEVNGRVSALIELGAGFHPDLTGRENIYLNSAILGLSRQEVNQKFDQIVEFSGLEKFLDTPVKRYSSGMYVRLGFSVAAHVNPDILLVDEVLAVGDAQFNQRCAQRIHELRRNGTTIVFVTHNIYLIKSVCDTAIFMLNGKVQKHSDAVTVIQEYETWIRQTQARSAIADGKNGETIVVSPYRLDRIDILTEGKEVDEFQHSDPVELCIHYHVGEPIEKPNLIIHIDRSDGTRCCMIRTADYGINLGKLKGRGIISVIINPLQLSQGVYAIEAHLVGAFDGISLAQAHSNWFRVRGISAGQDLLTGIFIPNIESIKVHA